MKFPLELRCSNGENKGSSSFILSRARKMCRRIKFSEIKPLSSVLNYGFLGNVSLCWTCSSATQSQGLGQAHICMEKQENSGKYKHFTALMVDGIDFPSPAISQSVCAFTDLSVLVRMSYCKHNFHIDLSPP